MSEKTEGVIKNGQSRNSEHCADKIQDEDKQNTTQHRKQKR